MADTLAASLIDALAELTVVEKLRAVDITTKAGKTIHYGYADIADVVKLTRPTLHEHGLVALTPVHDHGDGLACTVIILHTSGERLDLGPFPFPHGHDAQATGSMVTYHRRYALIAALGMAAGDDDDDGAAAKPRQAETPIPGFRSSLMATVEKLTDIERSHLREWLKAEGLPDRPSLMDAEQADRVCEFILHDLPVSAANSQSPTNSPDVGSNAPALPLGDTQ